MSHKDNLRDPSRRARILAKRAQGFTEIPVMLMKGPAVAGIAPTFMQRLKSRLSKSKYTPHFGKKQSKKIVDASISHFAANFAAF
jgi:hypothetical protein